MLKGILIAAVFIAGLAALVWYMVVSEEDRLKRLTSSTTGEVIELIVQTDDESDDATTIVRYNYVVAGQKMGDQATKPDDVSSSFPRGSVVTVCYDPNDPGETEPFSGRQTCPAR